MFESLSMNHLVCWLDMADEKRCLSEDRYIALKASTAWKSMLSSYEISLFSSNPISTLRNVLESSHLGLQGLAMGFLIGGRPEALASFAYKAPEPRKQGSVRAKGAT